MGVTLISLGRSLGIKELNCRLVMLSAVSGVSWKYRGYIYSLIEAEGGRPHCCCCC